MRTARYLGCVALLLSGVFLGGVCKAATFYVPDDYPDIQWAICVASDGDTIIVRPGIYYENIDCLGKQIWIKSEAGPASTVIDGTQGSVVVNLPMAGNDVAILEGFTIENGGIGVCCTGGARVSNNVIRSNSDSGIRCYDNTIIEFNTVYGNSRPTGGGGITCIEYSGIIRDNTIAENTSNNGAGGISADMGSSARISGNVICRNEGDCAGGIYVLFSDMTTISGNLLVCNKSTGDGGGISLYFAFGLLANNWIVGNSSAWDGGGLSCMTPENQTTILYNNVICGNTADHSGGGMYAISEFIEGELEVVNCTIADNQAVSLGGGVDLMCSATFINSILWGNTAPLGAQIFGGADVSFSDVEGGWPGTGNIDKDPAFADALSEDYHLLVNSPCIDSGNDQNPYLSQFDFEGDPRISLNHVDMGADERHLHLYVVGDVVPGTTIDIKVIGDPAQGPIRIGISQGKLETPINTQYGNLYLKNPYRYFTFGNIPSNGLFSYNFQVPQWWTSGLQYYLQALVGPLAGTRTRLTNCVELKIE